jgi:putative nucleotidyltransferase with HDIG domain
MNTAKPNPVQKRTVYFVLLLAVSYIVVAFSLVLPNLLNANSTSLQEGQVAAQDIQAPRTVTYVSPMLTEQERANAAQSIPPVYSSPDTAVARRQLERLRSALAYINSVRADAYATTEQKISDLRLMQDVPLTAEQAQAILQMNDLRWQAIQQEAIVVLEQAMRVAIREERVEEIRHSLPTMVSLALSEDQVSLVVLLVEPFIAANSFYNEELTLAAREKAAQAVSPVTRTFQAGETIVQRGRVLKAEDIEALQALGLVQTQAGWELWIQAALVSFLVVTFLFFYIRRKKTLSQDIRALTILCALFLGFLVTARLLPANSLFPYVFPYAAFGMVIAVLLGSNDIAMIASVCLGMLVAYAHPDSLGLLMYTLISSLFGILTLGRGRRIMAFVLAGLTGGASGALILIVLNRLSGATDPFAIASITGAVFVGGIASAGLAILLQFLSAQYLGLTTALHLMEISRPDHPLLHFLLTNAPGTYQHSLQVANLAEQAAERIHADTLLTRVGALYHDIGKALNPAFYIENQVAGSPNPHDNLDPIVSAKIIIGHVTEGLNLARKYRLPSRIQDFISEHHGTMIARYQYANAVKAANGDESKVDIAQFRYPGPKPKSRETAILMLADGCEARVRAERPKDEQEMRQVIKSVFDNRIALGQLDQTNLTLHDLSELMDAFAAILRGVYHPRIEYPKLETSSPSGENQLTGGELTQPTTQRSEPRLGDSA